MQQIDVYDFDHTIYDGNAMVDFYLFALSRQLSLLRYAPIQAWHTVFFLAKVESRTTYKGHFFVFLRAVKDSKAVAKQFWETNDKKIKIWYLNQDHKSDVIVSASPEFLLQAISHKLQVQKLIATRLDTSTGKVIGDNCYGAEKLRRIQVEMPQAIIRSCYSDSLSDLPILNAAKTRYLVKGDNVIPFKPESV